MCVIETGLPSQYLIVLAIFCVCYRDWATFSIRYCTGHILCVLYRLGYLLNTLLYWPYSVCVTETGLPSQYVIVLAIFCVCYTDWATFSICYCTGHILCVLYRLGYLLNMLLYWPYSVCVTETGLPSQYVIVLAIFCVSYRAWVTFSMSYCIHKWPCHLDTQTQMPGIVDEVVIPCTYTIHGLCVSNYQSLPELHWNIPNVTFHHSHIYYRHKLGLVTFRHSHTHITDINWDWLLFVIAIHILQI